MSMVNRGHLSDLRGVVRLAVDATVGVTDLVEQMHHTIQLRHPPVGVSHAGKTGGITGFVYNSIRGVTRLVGRGIDAGMVPVTALLPDGASDSARDDFVSAINGVLGDHLVNTGNPLAIEMGLRCAGLPIDHESQGAIPDAANGEQTRRKILLFVHGLCLNEGHWIRGGENRGEALAKKLGYIPAYLRYNTGLSIAENGHKLAEILEKLQACLPQSPYELSIIGHSMGGLVARSACHHGRQAGHDWLKQLRKMVFIGSPHHGAPLERGGNWLNYVMDLSPYAAPFTRIGNKRSAGITDLGYGCITDKPKEHVPLPADVECYTIAGTLAKKSSQIGGRLIGDGLVPLDSALGYHKDSARALVVPENRQWIGFETGHMELLSRPGVYAQLSNWLE